MEDQSDLNILLSSGGCVTILFLSSDQLPYREMIDEVLAKKKAHCSHCPFLPGLPTSPLFQ